jgi:hypothetical protein
MYAMSVADVREQVGPPALSTLSHLLDVPETLLVAWGLTTTDMWDEDITTGRRISRRSEPMTRELGSGSYCYPVNAALLLTGEVDLAGVVERICQQQVPHARTGIPWDMLREQLAEDPETDHRWLTRICVRSGNDAHWAMSGMLNVLRHVPQVADAADPDAELVRLQRVSMVHCQLSELLELQASATWRESHDAQLRRLRHRYPEAWGRRRNLWMAA